MKLSTKDKNELRAVLLEAGYPVGRIWQRGGMFCLESSVGDRREAQVKKLVRNFFKPRVAPDLFVWPESNIYEPVSFKKMSGALISSYKKHYTAGVKLISKTSGRKEKSGEWRKIVEGLSETVDTLRLDKPLPSRTAATKRVTSQLAATWAECVCQHHGWRVVSAKLRSQRGLAVVAPEHKYICWPEVLLLRVLTEKAPGDNTTLLLFNMIGIGNLPRSKPFEYVCIH